MTQRLTQASRMVCFLVCTAALFWLPSPTAAQSGTVTDDAFVSKNATTELLNFKGKGISLIVAGSAATAGATPVGMTATYIRFQLTSSLPPSVAAANVQKATLKLFLSPSTSPTGAIDIFPVTGAWTESALTSSTAPTLAPVAFATDISLGSADSFVVVDVTQLVQEWLEGPSNGGVANEGIALVAHTSSTYAVFDSKENFVTSHEPRLEIVLVDSGPQGPAGPPGQPGANGQQGPQGIAATIKVEPAMTVPAGTPASVLNAGTPNAADLTFLIPQGATGAQGPQGAVGPVGPQGTQGPIGQAGPQGIQGPQGQTGQTGAQGPQGVPGAPGATGPAGPTGPVGINNRNMWASGTSYNPNDAVSYSNSFWLAIAADSSAQPPPGNPNWQLLAAGINNQGAWNGATAYNPRDTVFHSGSYWLAAAANTNSEPSQANANWQLLAGGVVNRGVWSGLNSYNVNDTVTDAGSYWLAVVPTSANNAVPNTSCEPSLPACAADWQLLAAAGASGALTSTSNTFTASQTISGNLTISGAGNGIVLPDGTKLTSAPLPSPAMNRMFVSAFFPGSLITPYTAAQFSPDKDITVTRATANVKTVPTTNLNSLCPVSLKITDGTHFIDLPLGSIEFPQPTSSLDTHPFSFEYTAGSNISLQLAQVSPLAAPGCVTTPSTALSSDLNLIVEYKMHESTDTNACYAGTVGATSMCNGSCVDVSDFDFDNANCGGCGSVCNASGCALGGCQFSNCSPCQSCQIGFTQCNSGDSFCVNLASDVNNCGGCGNSCGTLQNGTFICSQAACVPQCNAGFADCGQIGQCETNLSTDRGNCGACGFACAATQVCSNGQCLVPSGGACTQNNQCVSGLCVGVLGQNLHCE